MPILAARVPRSSADRQHSRSVASYCLLGVFLLALTSLLGCGGGAGEGEVWILGLDGADWDILDPMIERGELPNLAKLRSEGAYGRLRSEEPLLSPMIWTSIATGKTPDQHGVTWFMTDSPTGEKIPVSSRNRWVRALWNIATEHQRSSTVIGWWATWPVEPIDGFLVSDYVGWHSFGVTGQEVDAPGKVWPTEAQPELLGKLPSPDDVDDELLLTMVDLPPDLLRFDASRGPFGGPLPHLRQAIATARGYTDIALHLLERRRTDFFAVYYEGTDATMHLFTNYAPPQQDWVSDDDYAAFQNAIVGYWQYQDRLLGELLERRKPSTTVIVVSDHGFRTGNERLREEEFSIELADASHMIDGVIVLNGPGIAAGTQIRGADIYDVAPTVLHLMGLAVADDMKGEVLLSALTEEHQQQHPVQSIATYETGAWDRGDDIVIDAAAGKNMEEMLRSLGYISGGEESGGAGSTDDVVDPSGAMTVEHAVNFAIVLEEQGRMEEAAALLREQLEKHPENLKVRLNLAKVYGESGEFDRALPLFAALWEERPGDLEVIEDYALGLARSGQIERAVEVYDAGLTENPRWATGLAGRGLAVHQLGRSDEGLRDVERAIELDPRLSLAHYHLGLVQSDRGDFAAAERAYRRTLELDPSHVQAALQVAQALQQRGEMEQARTYLQDRLDKVGPASAVSAEIAAIDLRMGEPESALVILQDAVESHPDDTILLGNLGIALAMTGAMDEAEEAFQRVVALDPQSANAHAQLGNLYLQTGRLAEGESSLQRAVALEPSNAQVQMTLATHYHRAGRLPEAMSIYEDILAVDPNHALALYQLALATGATGNDQKAMEMLTRARQLDPSLPMPGQRQ